MVLEKTLESPLDCKDIQPVHPKGDRPEYSLEGLMLKLQYFSHKIKRHLLLGRKVMTNLDSVLKNRDIILPTNVHIVKGMVFPVVMYGCESWTIRNLSAKELMLLN